MYFVDANKKLHRRNFSGLTFVRTLDSMVGGLLGFESRRLLGWDSGDHDTVGGIA